MILAPEIIFVDDLDQDGVLNDFEFGGFGKFIIPVPSSVSIDNDSIRLNINGLFDAVLPLNTPGMVVDNEVSLIMPLDNGDSLTITASWVVGGIEGDSSTSTIVAQGMIVEFPDAVEEGPNYQAVVSEEPIVQVNVKVYVHPESLGKNYVVGVDSTYGTLPPIVTPSSVVVNATDISNGFFTTTLSVPNGRIYWLLRIIVQEFGNVKVLANDRISTAYPALEVSFPQDSDMDGVLGIVELNLDSELGGGILQPMTIRIHLPYDMTPAVTTVNPSTGAFINVFVARDGVWGGAGFGIALLFTEDDIAAGYLDYSITNSPLHVGHLYTFAATLHGQTQLSLLSDGQNIQT